jgi:hypothetical protein
MGFRIKKHPEGFVAEVKKTKTKFFIQRNYWTHYVSVYGIASMPWYYKTEEAALKGLLDEIKWDTLHNSSQ